MLYNNGPKAGSLAAKYSTTFTALSLNLSVNRLVLVKVYKVDFLSFVFFLSFFQKMAATAVRVNQSTKVVYNKTTATNIRG